MSARRYLLTGPCGVVGEAVAAALGELPVLVLTRRQRPAWVASAHELAVGDLRQPRLGLARDTYRRLTRTVGCVIHCAGMSRYGAAPHALREANVTATRNVVRFAEQADASVVHVSTALLAMGPAHDAQERQAFGLGEYLRTKRIAEELLLESDSRITIVRPSLVIGDSHSGYTPRFQLVHSIVRLLIEGTIPVLPIPAHARVDFLPRDVVARHIAALVRRDAHDRPDEAWLTAGSAAMSVEQLLELISAFARAKRHPVEMPRRVDPDVVERLIVPAILPELPRRAGIRLRQLIGMVEPLTLTEDLPSTLADPPTAKLLRSTIQSNLAYWYEQTFEPREQSA